MILVYPNPPHSLPFINVIIYSKQTIINLNILVYKLEDHSTIYLAYTFTLLSTSFVPGTIYYMCYNMKFDSCSFELKCS